MKTCTKCSTEKPLAEFYADKRRGGFLPACKECTRAQQRAHFTETREQKLAANRESYHRNRGARLAHCAEYQKEHPEVGRRAGQKYRETHREESRDRARRYQREHPELYREYARKQKEKNPERVLAWYHTSRAHMAGALGSFTEQEWLALLDACSHHCVKCGKHESEVEPRKDRPVILEVDHIVPLSRGGSGHISNIQPLCWRCNNHKRKRIEDHRPAEVRAIFPEQIVA